MDSDTAAVVFIAGVIIIAVFASYATYQWVVNNSQNAVTYRFTSHIDGRVDGLLTDSVLSLQKEIYTSVKHQHTPQFGLLPLSSSCTIPRS